MTIHLASPVHGPAPVSQAFGVNNPGREPLVHIEAGSGGYWFNDVGMAGNWHAGIDYAVPTGTPLYAPAPGMVHGAGWDITGFGYCVQIDHGGVFTLFAHLERILCAAGQQLRTGQEFALTDSTGNSTAPHLHFAVFTMLDGWQVFHNPAPYLAGLHPLPPAPGPKPAEQGH